METSETETSETEISETEVSEMEISLYGIKYSTYITKLDLSYTHITYICR